MFAEEKPHLQTLPLGARSAITSMASAPFIWMVASK